ncbi:MAG: DUF4239 domain-containing protein [Planctomycetes bacterium]|nr:DUF4239 domain-containing protein [Planctomycetota bacterium]
MPFATAIDFIPLWLLLGTIVIVVLSVEAGYQLGGYRRRRSEQEKEVPVGSIVAATIGLLAFMLAFTFGLAVTRFEARRQVVVDEANAIGTTFLRAGLLPDHRGPKVRKLLREYVDVRLEAIKPGKLEAALQRSGELQRLLWAEAEAVGVKHSGSITVGLFLQSLNSTIDLHVTRVQVAIRNRIPGVVWAVLYLITILTMAGVGYHSGLTRTTRSLAIVVLAVTFSAIMLLIADLDRPQEGLLRVGQQALIDLRNTMNEQD